LTLHVYDLYYKKKTNVEMWWKGLDSGNGGTVKLGFPITPYNDRSFLGSWQSYPSPLFHKARSNPVEIDSPMFG
jgi:hypothetical protein